MITKIREDDTFDVIHLAAFSPGKPVIIRIHHADGSTDEIRAGHSYNENQIEWFKAGSSLNLIRIQQSKEIR
jgi:aconitate hydratase